MTELNTNNLEKTNDEKSKLGKIVDSLQKLSEQELNAPIEDLDNLEIPNLASADCRSECKYNTKGDSSKRMNYGYSG